MQPWPHETAALPHARAIGAQQKLDGHSVYHIFYDQALSMVHAATIQQKLLGLLADRADLYVDMSIGVVQVLPKMLEHHNGHAVLRILQNELRPVTQFTAKSSVISKTNQQYKFAFQFMGVLPSNLDLARINYRFGANPNILLHTQYTDGFSLLVSGQFESHYKVLISDLRGIGICIVQINRKGDAPIIVQTS